MVLLFVTYPAREGGHFDRDYYVRTHLPLAEKAWGGCGLVSARAFWPATEADLVAVAVLAFENGEAVEAALASEAAAAVMADVPNFTDLAPQILRGVAL